MQSLLDNIDNDIGYVKIREYGRTYGFHNMYNYFYSHTIDILED